jgi:tape measure domain-containing protein
MPGEAFRLRGVVDVDTSPADKGLSALDQRVSAFGKQFSEGLGIGAGVAAFGAGLKVIGDGIGALKASVIDFNQQLDMSRNIFTRYFEGNTKVADAFLNSLKRFAAETPFEFKDLSSLSVRLQSVGIAANDIIPTIKAIGNAASASGSLSQEALGRIGLAIQQMIGKGKVSAEEMNQLIEGGVTNAWQILAKEVGVTEAQVRKMSEQGLIAGETMVKALRSSYEHAGLMEQASKSLTGALSTIRDVGTQAFAEMGRSIYELATEGANQLAKLLSSEQFQTWVQAGVVAVSGLVSAIKGGMESLAPIGAAISAAFGFFTEGNFAAGFQLIGRTFTTVLMGMMDGVTAFASRMVGAGENIVGEFATGILNGANGVLQAAIDTVANLIASFFIGNSPPSAGPLAQIEQGGANTIQAWGKGAADAADEAVKPAVAKVAGGLQDLKTAARGVDESIRDIGKAIHDIDAITKDVKFSIDDLKEGYKDQLEPLQQQLDVITQRKDYEYEEQSLLLQLEESELKRAENAAQGSREIRARIDDQIEELNLQKKGIEQAQKRDELDKKARGERSAAEDRLERLRDRQKDTRGGGDSDRVKALEKQLESVRGGSRSRGKSEAERRLEEIRSAGRSGGSGSAALDDEKEGLRVQEARLSLQEKRQKLLDRQRKGEDVSFDLQQLGIDEAQLALSIKEYAQKKQDAADEVRRQQAIAALEKQVRQEKEDDDKKEEQRKDKAAKLEKQIAAEKQKDQDTQRSRQKEIDDAERVVRDEKRQAQMAEAKRQQVLAGIDREILDLNQQKANLVDKPRLAAIKDAQAELKERKDILDTAQREDKLRRDMAALPIKQQIEAIKQEEKDRLAPLQEQLDSLTRQKSTLTEQKQVQQEIKAEIQAQASAIRDAESATKAAAKAAKEARDAAPKAPTDKSFTPDAIAEQAIAKAKENGARLAGQLRDGFVEWITANPIVTGATLAGMLFGAGRGAAIGASLGSVVPVIGTAIGGILGAGIGAAIGGIAVGQLAGQLQAKIEAIIGQPIMTAVATRFMEIRRAFNEDGFGGIVTAVLRTLGEAAPRIGGLLTQWSTVLLDWVRNAAPPFFNGLQAIIDGVYRWIETNAGPIGQKLVAWQIAFVQWIGTAGLDLLSKLAALAGDVLNWIGANATKLAGKLLEWATEFITWVGPVIPKLLTEFGKLIARTVEWMGQHTGELLDAIGRWAVEFVNWVGPKIPPLLAALGRLLVSLTDWVIKDALPAIAGKLLEWGSAIVDWVGPRIQPLLTELGKLLLSVGNWIVTDALPAIVTQLAQWAVEFVQWVVPVWARLLLKLGELSDSIKLWITQQADVTNPNGFAQALGKWGLAFLGWIATDVVPHLVAKLVLITLEIGTWIANQVNPSNADGIVGKAAALGAGMLTGIQKGLSDNWGSLQQWITDNIGKKLPEWMQKLLGIHSPSTVFHEIGSNLIAGLIGGMQSKSGELLAAAQGLFGTIGGPGAISMPTGALVDIARMMAGEYGIDPDIFVRQIKRESNFDPTAVNPRSGAAGLGQFMPGTAVEIARQLGMSVAALMGNPANQLRGAAHYDRQMLTMFRGDVVRMLAAYNWGPGNVRSWSGNLGDLPGETRTYLRDILGLQNGGIISPTPGGTVVRVGEGTHREVVAPLPDWMNVGNQGRQPAPLQRHEFVLRDPSGRVLAEWYIRGRDVAVETRRAPLGTI